MLKIESKLSEMGIELPILPTPLAAYVPGVMDNGYIYTSGQLPLINGELKTGKLGYDLAEQEAYEAAKTCALNCLAVIKSLAGSLDRIDRFIKVTGFVNSTPESTNHPL